jgi:hypothetical protein
MPGSDDTQRGPADAPAQRSRRGREHRGRRQALAGLAAELGATGERIDDIKTAVSEAGDQRGRPRLSRGGEGAAGDLRDAGRPQPRDPGARQRCRDAAPPGHAGGAEPAGRAGADRGASDGLEIRGEQGAGTEVRISFDLEGARAGPPVFGPVLEPDDVDTPTSRSRVPSPAARRSRRCLSCLRPGPTSTLDRLPIPSCSAISSPSGTARAAIDSRPLEVAIAEDEGLGSHRAPGAGRRRTYAEPGRSAGSGQHD